MRRAATLSCLLVIAVLHVAAGAAAQYDPLPPPSRWGPGDEAGNSNTQTPKKVLEAVKLIRTGRKFLLGHEYDSEMPLFPGNTWMFASKGPVPLKRQVSNLDHLAGDITQSGTQFDALGHFGILPPGAPTPRDALYYNRFTGRDVFRPLGLQHLGVENMKPFFTRGILIDVKRYVNDDETLEPGKEITVEMTKQTLAAQRLSAQAIRKGDVVLFRTGWEEFWDDGTLTYYNGAPGLGGGVPGVGLNLARWLAAKKVAAVGADNWGVEVFPAAPGAPEGVDAPVHNELIVRNGIPHQESMSLRVLADALAKDLANGDNRPYQFAYVYVPVPIRGATGSPGLPMAIR